MLKIKRAAACTVALFLLLAAFAPATASTESAARSVWSVESTGTESSTLIPEAALLLPLIITSRLAAAVTAATITATACIVMDVGGNNNRPSVDLVGTP